MPKLNEVAFYGFTEKELEAVRRETGFEGEEEFTLDFIQKVADITGCDVSTLILANAPITMMKVGEVA